MREKKTFFFFRKYADDDESDSDVEVVSAKSGKSKRKLYVVRQMPT
jgi:hypothetical protein